MIPRTDAAIMRYPIAKIGRAAPNLFDRILGTRTAHSGSVTASNSLPEDAMDAANAVASP